MAEIKEEELKALFNQVDNILAKTDLCKVTAESAGFEDLPKGYFLSELVTAELTTSKSKGTPQIVFKFKTVDDGYEDVVDDNGDVTFVRVPKTSGRIFYMYFGLNDEASVKKFVSNALKFEGDEPGKPVLEKEYFTTAETLADALEILEGRRVYVNVTFTPADPKKGTQDSFWKNIITWKRATELELPE